MTGPLAVSLVGRYTTLTPLVPEDAAGLLRAASEDRSAFEFTAVPNTLEEAKAAIEGLLEDQVARSAVPFATRRSADGEIVGMTRFLTLRWWFDRGFPDAAEIGGTFLAGSAQRTAINTEAKLLMMGHAFEVWGVQRLDLKTDARNERSRRAIERLGARFDGVLRHWQPSTATGEAGLVRDSAMYSVLPEEWPEVRGQLESLLH